MTTNQHRIGIEPRRRTRRAAALLSIGLLAAGGTLVAGGVASASTGGMPAAAVAATPDEPGPGEQRRDPEHLVELLRAALAPLVGNETLTQDQVDAVVAAVLSGIETHRAEMDAERAERMESRMAERAERMEERMAQRAERMGDRAERMEERMEERAERMAEHGGPMGSRRP